MFLGIDTSCYTTSIAILDDTKALIADQRALLKVKKDSCGLRQSEMVFQHVKNIPLLLDKALEGRLCSITAIAVSSTPRSLEHSYMPAFVAGTSFAKSLATVTGAKLYLTDHQQNHLRAGLFSTNCSAKEFIALHASGGTTDLLFVKDEGTKLDITELGSSLDISAGQFVDRVGIALGLDFPCGKELEQLALGAALIAKVPVFAKEFKVSYSGPLTAVEKMIDKNIDKKSIAAGVQKALAVSFSKVLLNASKKTGCKQVLLVGGVSSNKFICSYVQEQLAFDNINLHLPEAQYCSDNALGCAYIAYQNWSVSN